MADTMRGVYTNLTAIRRSVFREVAKVIYDNGRNPNWTLADFDKAFEELPYKIIPGDVATYRESVFLERAIVSERIRLAARACHRLGAHPSGCRPFAPGRRQAGAYLGWPR